MKPWIYAIGLMAALAAVIAGFAVLIKLFGGWGSVAVWVAFAIVAARYMIFGDVK